MLAAIKRAFFTPNHVNPETDGIGEISVVFHLWIIHGGTPNMIELKFFTCMAATHDGCSLSLAF